MPEHFRRLERFVRSAHPLAEHRDTMVSLSPDVQRGLAYRFANPDGASLYAWVRMAADGKESVVISKVPPGAHDGS